MCAEELVTGLSRVSWEKVDVSFHNSRSRFAAHSVIQVVCFFCICLILHAHGCILKHLGVRKSTFLGLWTLHTSFLWKSKWLTYMTLLVCDRFPHRGQMRFKNICCYSAAVQVENIMCCQDILGTSMELINLSIVVQCESL